MDENRHPLCLGRCPEGIELRRTQHLAVDVAADLYTLQTKIRLQARQHARRCLRILQRH
nr:hypothetical protein [Sphingobium sp. BS19]